MRPHPDSSLSLSLSSSLPISFFSSLSSLSSSPPHSLPPCLPTLSIDNKTCSLAALQPGQADPPSWRLRKVRSALPPLDVKGWLCPFKTHQAACSIRTYRFCLSNLSLPSRSEVWRLSEWSVFWRRIPSLFFFTSLLCLLFLLSCAFYEVHCFHLRMRGKHRYINSRSQAFWP